jgi:hypothetical protein
MYCLSCSQSVGPWHLCRAVLASYPSNEKRIQRLEERVRQLENRTRGVAGQVLDALADRGLI